MVGIALVAGVVLIGLGVGLAGFDNNSGSSPTDYVPSSGPSSLNGSTPVPTNTQSQTMVSRIPVTHSVDRPLRTVSSMPSNSSELDSLSVKWKNDPNPGIDICRFNNGNSQCQSAAVLQSLMNVNADAEDGKIYNLIEAMKNKTNGNIVDINNFLNDFKTSYLNDNSLDKDMLKRFMTGKLETLKPCPPGPDGSLKGIPRRIEKVGGASDYLNALIRLLQVKNQNNWRLMLASGADGLGYPTVMFNILSEHCSNDMSTTLDNAISNSVPNGEARIVQAPKHLLISVEQVLPKNLLKIMSNDAQFTITLQADVDGNVHRYKLKSMVLRSTPREIMTENNIEQVNKSGATHFVCVINSGNKYIKIDSLTPQVVESCTNENILNVVKRDNGNYLMPVVMVFERDDES